MVARGAEDAISTLDLVEAVLKRVLAEAERKSKLYGPVLTVDIE
jgi:hypothetical protein